MEGLTYMDTLRYCTKTCGGQFTTQTLMVIRQIWCVQYGGYSSGKYEKEKIYKGIARESMKCLMILRCYVDVANLTLCDIKLHTTNWTHTEDVGVKCSF